MDEQPTKPWYQSKTVLASLFAVLLTILTALKVTHVGAVQVDQVAAEQDNLIELISQIGVVVASAVAIYGRVTAKAKIASGSGSGT